MHPFLSLRSLTAVLCLTAISAPAQQTRRSRLSQPSLSNQRVPLQSLPPPPTGSHGHPPDVRPGTTPCGYRTTSANCPGSGRTADSFAR